MANIGDLGAELNLLCRKGHTIGPFFMTWTDESEPAIPVDITNATFSSSIRQNKKATIDLDSFTITKTGLLTGEFTVELSAVDCAALPISDDLFYLVSATIDGVKTPLFYGNLVVRQG